MNQELRLRQPRFFMTAPAPCPYLPGRMERKVFTYLTEPRAGSLNDALTQAGFRRSQNIAYRPACDGCAACVSVRVLANAFAPGRTLRRIARRNRDLTRGERDLQGTREQFQLIRAYLDSRHAEGGMAGMTYGDYLAMVEESPVSTRVIEYRDGTDRLVACALTDVLSDGLSMVYSFFDPALEGRSLGTFMVHDHVTLAVLSGLPHVYLGYWIADCRKMAYKARFRPMERLTPEGWQRFEADDAA